MNRNHFALVIVGIIVAGALALLLPPAIDLWKLNQAAKDRRGGNNLVEFTLRMVPPKPIADAAEWRTIERKVANTLRERSLTYCGERPTIRFTLPPDSRVIVRIPERVYSVELVQTLGSSARMEFRWAKSVQTQQDASRRYRMEWHADALGQDKYDLVDTTDLAGSKKIPSGSKQLVVLIHSPTEGWDLIADGSMIRRAWAIPMASTYEVQLEFDTNGTKRLRDFSEMVQGRGEYLPILLNNNIISFPRMNAVIFDGKAVIEGGNMTGKEALKLASILSGGALPVKLDYVSSRVVRK